MPKPIPECDDDCGTCLDNGFCMDYDDGDRADVAHDEEEGR